MKFTDYLHNCLNGNYATQNRLEATEKTLLNCFRNLRAFSEATGKEHGVILRRQLLGRSAESLGTGLSVSDIIVGASGNAVDLKTKDVKLEHDYIGDCHTHPYQ